ncbi:MAG: hypothetical protein ACOC2W_03710 [bacterium]
MERKEIEAIKKLANEWLIKEEIINGYRSITLSGKRKLIRELKKEQKAIESNIIKFF